MSTSFRCPSCQSRLLRFHRNLWMRLLPSSKKLFCEPCQQEFLSLGSALFRLGKLITISENQALETQEPLSLSTNDARLRIPRSIDPVNIDEKPKKIETLKLWVWTRVSIRKPSLAWVLIASCFFLSVALYWTSLITMRSENKVSHAKVDMANSDASTRSKLKKTSSSY